MGSNALHRLRHHSRRLAAAAVAVFALNWLGLALMPCAMAYALPEAPAAQQQKAADAALPGCPGHAGVATTHDAPPAAPSGEPCPWCLEAGTTGGHHDAGCGAIPKPALDSRDAKNPVTPQLVALSAAVLGVVPFESSAPSFAPADDALPPAAPAVDRYCRRLE